MKKCPKCGTILDDSKKKCYMCGTLLNEENTLAFAEALDQAVGGKVTKESDNVFNNGEDIKVNSKDIVKKNSDKAYYSVNGDSLGAFSEELNRLTSIQTETTKKENKKILKKESEESSLKKELQKEEQLERKKQYEEKKAAREEEARKSAEIRQQKRLEKIQSLKKTKVEKENKNKKIRKVQSSKFLNFDTKKPIKETFSIPKSSIVNTICVLVFVALLVFAYKNYSKKPTKTTNFSGLTYIIPSTFKNVSSDAFAKYYTYGDSCSIRITYGTEKVTGSSFVDDFLEEQRRKLESDSKNKAKITQEKINDNTWSSMEIISFAENVTNQTLEEKLKYKYAAILYNGNFYYIVFVNNANDQTCKSMYTEFENSLTFEQ